jgi:hypothetical protein
MNGIETIARRNMLRWHVSQEMFCPRCGKVLDCRQAVEVDITRGTELAGSLIMCAPCYDGRIGDPVMPEGVRLEVHDGRVLFGKRKNGVAK